jgi:hypothetical protein
VDVDALKYEDKFYFGNEKLFKKMLQTEVDMTELSLPRA